MKLGRTNLPIIPVRCESLAYLMHYCSTQLLLSSSHKALYKSSQE